MPDRSVAEQLLFAEGLMGLGGVVGRPCSKWWDRAFAAESGPHVPVGRQVGLVWAGLGRRAVAYPL
eukprot:365542-Chlamydomonas_euryale.AAC.6